MLAGARFSPPSIRGLENASGPFHALSARKPALSAVERVGLSSLSEDHSAQPRSDPHPLGIHRTLVTSDLVPRVELAHHPKAEVVNAAGTTPGLSPLNTRFCP